MNPNLISGTSPDKCIPRIVGMLGSINNKVAVYDCFYTFQIDLKKKRFEEKIPRCLREAANFFLVDSPLRVR